MNSIKWGWIYFVVVVALGFLTLLGGLSWKSVPFFPTSGESIVDLLTPLFVIALFLERAQEVFVTSWRALGRHRIEHAMTEIKARLATATQTNVPVEIDKETTNLNNKIKDLFHFRADTARISFLFGVSVGVFVSIVGVRALEPLIDLSPGAISDFQKNAITVVDIVFTGALIGGGSEGIHKLVSVVTDFLDQTRKNIKRGNVK